MGREHDESLAETYAREKDVVLRQIYTYILLLDRQPNSWSKIGRNLKHSDWHGVQAKDLAQVVAE